MKKNKNVPKLRFPGFTDAWEQRKFSELVTIERGGSPRPIDKFITKDEKGLNWVKIGDAPELGNYITQTAEKIRPEGLSKTREVHPGDLILSNSMSFGRPYIMAINGCIHDGWLAIRDTKKNFDLKFLCMLLGTDNMLSQYKAMAAGSTVNNLNKELVGGTTVSYPAMEEQIKLGEYFESIDNLITLHQRKCDEIKMLKTCLLQKMFPKDGEDFPEIRFPGFTDEWEQRKLEAVVDSIDTGKSKFDKEGSSGEYPILGSTSVIGYDDEYDYEGDFILTARVGANAGSLYRHAGKVKISDNTVFIQASKNIEFLYHLLTQFDIKKLSFGTGQPLVKASELKNLELMMPTDINEQMKIGDYFKQLNNLITLHQRKTEELKLYKKYLLQNMFA